MFTYDIIDNKNFSKSNPKLILARMKTRGGKYGYFSEYVGKPPYIKTTLGVIKAYLVHKLSSSI